MKGWDWQSDSRAPAMASSSVHGRSKRAEAAAQQVRSTVASADVRGLANADAAAEADAVLVSVPYAGLAMMRSRRLRRRWWGRFSVSLVCPLQFGKGGPHAIPVEEGSAAEQARAAAPQSRVVGAFHNLSAHELMEPDLDLGCDVIVCSDDREAKRDVMALAEQLKGVRGVDGGGWRTRATWKTSRRC